VSEEILKVKEKYEELLRGVKGVTGVGLNGSIIVYVERITPELRRVIPKELEGVPVHVKESGPVTLMSLVPMAAIYANRVDKWRPAPGGVSVGHPEVTAGTLACRALDRITERVFGLTNNHVGALDWGELHVGKVGDPILQPGPVDGGIEDGFGELINWVPVKTDEDNYVDATIFKSAELRKDVLDVGKPSYTVEPRVGRNILKSGRSSGVNFGKITDVNATMVVDGGEGMGECLFKNQIVIEPAILIPGDSGSWIGEIDTYNSVGLGFAGSDILSIANRALTVEELLNIEIIPPMPSIKPSVMAGLFLAITGIGLQLSYGGGVRREL